MAEIRRQPFQTVKVDIEEMDRKIREHRIRMLKRAGIVLGILILLWFLLYIYHQVRTYDSHEAKSNRGQAGQCSEYLSGVSGQYFEVQQ